MGFYVRKSIRVGPVRFNLSQSGIGASIGVKGLRIGTGPRGNYVHAGRNGFYYRASLPSAPSKPIQERLSPPTVNESQPVIPADTHDPLKDIESGSVMQMSDETSAGLLEELNKKRKKIRFWPILGSITALILVLTQGNNAGWILLVGGILTGGAFYFDQMRKTVVLFYDFEPEKEALFATMHDAFRDMTTCQGAWHISAQGNVRDRKYHAGASNLIKRSNISLKASQPSFVKTNIDVPMIPVGRQELYFFPDRLLVFDKGAVGAVSYRDLVIDIAPTRFIEDGSVPRDAEVVDHTWRYVNKKGGPDKRFKDNRQLPIALYEEVHFKSNTGLNEVINLSKQETSRAFSEAIAKLVA